MKIGLFILFLVFTASIGLSQNESEFNKKYDSTFSIGNGKYLFYKKKKSALYDQKNEEFIIPFQKKYLYYYVPGDLLIQITDEDKTKIYDWEKGFNKKSEKKKVEHSSFDEVAETYFQCEALPHGLLLINEYYNPMPYDTPLSNIYGEDSISNEGDFVYPPRLPIEYKSGVFDTKSKEWLIKPENKSILLIGEYIFVYKYEKEKDENESRIEIYSINKDELLHFKTVSTSNNLKQKQSIINEILSLDSISKVPNSSTYYYSYKNDKKGLLKYCLFDTSCDPEFNIHLKTKYNFLHFTPSTRTIITSIENEEGFKYFRYNSESEKFENQSSFKKRLMITENSFEGVEDVFIDQKSTMEINGSIRFKFEYEHPFIVIQDVTPEYQYDMPLYDIYGFDSIDSTGSLAYPPPEPGMYASGVFNINENKWIINPRYVDVVRFAKNKFMTFEYKLDQSGRIAEMGMIIKLCDANGGIILNDSELNDLSPIEFVQTIFETDSIYRSSFQHEPRGLLDGRTDDFFDQFLTTRTNNKMRIYEVNKSVLNPGIYKISAIFDNPTNLQLISSSTLRDGYNAGLETVFIENKNTFKAHFQNRLYNTDSMVVIDLNENKGIFEVVYFEDEAMNELGLIQAIYKHSADSIKDSFGMLLLKNDSLMTSNLSVNEYSKLLKSSNSKVSYKYTYSKDQVVVQHEPILEERSEFLGYFWDNIEVFKLLQYELENNVVWIKENGAWKQIGQSYAELEETPYGYIGRTAKINESIDDNFTELYTSKSYDSITRNLKHQLSIYELLDKNMVPYTYDSISSFNMIIPYNFGYQLIIDSGKSILVDLNGKILCEDHFDTYYIEDGNIYGENEELYKIDDVWGDLIYDEEGNPILLQKAEKRKIDE